jgi:glucose dehydrogenase
MLVLRYVGLVALTLWLGGLLVLGAIVAPTVFEVLAARHIASDRLVAGAVFGEILRRYHVMSFTCGVVLLTTLVLRGVMGPRPIMFAARLIVAFLMLAATAYSGMIVAPQVQRVQASAGVAPSTLPENDPRRVQFAHLHRISTSIQAVPILGGLFLLLRELKD